MVCRQHRSRKGFSLVELIVVMAVLAILVVIVLRALNGIRERALISRANGELVMLSRVLEDYKNKWGDYPWVAADRTGEQVLWEALSGQRLPDGSVISSSGQSWLGDLVGFQFADRSGNLIAELPEERGLVGEDIVIVDPWNQPYQYHYRASAAANDPWQVSSFILLSLGPSGGEAFENDTLETSGVPESGLLPATYPEDDDTYDNILAP